MREIELLSWNGELTLKYSAIAIMKVLVDKVSPFNHVSIVPSYQFQPGLHKGQVMAFFKGYVAFSMRGTWWYTAR